MLLWAEGGSSKVVNISTFEAQHLYRRCGGWESPSRLGWSLTSWWLDGMPKNLKTSPEHDPEELWQGLGCLSHS